MPSGTHKIIVFGHIQEYATQAWRDEWCDTLRRELERVIEEARKR